MPTALYSVAHLLLAVAFRSSYTRGPWLLAVVGCYAGAKVLESLDAEVYAAGALASGMQVSGGGVDLFGLVVLRRLFARLDVTPWSRWLAESHPALTGGRRSR